MPFASALQTSLEVRASQVPSEIERGDTLEHVLDRYLLAVERNFDGRLVTSILLLSADGKRLSHGAGPNLPRAYREVIDGSEIGPRAGSCGTAAYSNRSVYVSDISTDALWADYRHLALPHGFRSCWSTPIHDGAGSVLGTFATYHFEVGAPTREEVESIEMIADHVAVAILCARGLERPELPGKKRSGPQLKLIGGEETGFQATAPWAEQLLQKVERFEALSAELARAAEEASSPESRVLLLQAAAEARRLVSAIRHRIHQQNGI